MPNDHVELTTSQLEQYQDIWLDHLGKTLRERLTALLTIFQTGRAVLADALEIVAPGKERAAALQAYQTFANRINDGAKEAELDLRLCVDSLKSDPSSRETWIEGPSPDEASLAQYTREAVSTIERYDALVQPTAVIRTSTEQENPEMELPLIRFFFSYAHHDDKLVTKLRTSLEKELKLSKSYRFEFWIDRNIEVGANWDFEIQKALAECHFGLLFVSRDFLVSQYITEKELPPFITGTKPVIPVGLRVLDFARINMKGLDVKQIFRLTRTGQRPRFYSECRGEIAEEFVGKLASEIEGKIKITLNQQSSLAVTTVKKGQRIRCQAKLPEEDIVIEFGCNIRKRLPEQIVPPDAAPTDFSQMEKENATLQPQNRTKAVDFLADWALSEDLAPFCAVLGEVGIGKTTTLMLLARVLDQRRQKDTTVPAVIFIDLKDYYFKGDPGLEEILQIVINRHWKGTGSRAITPQMIIQAVQERGALVIFDGLDERIIPLPQNRRDGFIRQLWSILPPRTHKPTPGKRPGKMIISCRSHYFPTITALSSAFTGESREGIREKDYQACIILPFNQKQVREYLKGMLGEERVDDAIAVIKSVHNLTDLSTRPYLLSLIAPELERLEQMKMTGHRVFGVTLYGIFVEKWLRRDDLKHQFTPEHKLQMMEELSAHLCSINQKLIPWRKVSKWLDHFLNQHPEIRERYNEVPAEVLNQDFRAATFCLRPDSEEEGFRFAHTSLYEYFLALYLVRALEDGRFSSWDLQLPSDETLDFAAQMLMDHNDVDTNKAVENWSKLLEDPTASAKARRAAFKMWLIAHEKNWLEPTPSSAQLQGLDLEGWQIGSKSNTPLDLRGASLVNSCLNHAVLHNVLLAKADANGASLRIVEFDNVSLDYSNWEKANFCGSTWRDCDAKGIHGRTSNWHDADLIRCNFSGSIRPANWAQLVCERLINEPAFVVLKQGHSASVWSVAWSIDSTRIVSGSSDQTLKIWDAESGKHLQSLAGHSEVVWCVAWSIDGTRIASGSWDKTVKIWDAESGKCLQSLAGHSDYVRCVAWSADGTRIVSGSDDELLKIWDAESGKCLRSLAGHSGYVWSVAWSADGKQIVSGSDDELLKIWDAESGKCLLTLTCHSDYLRSVALSTDGTMIASGSRGNSLKIWDAESGKCLRSLTGHTGSVRSVSWSADGTRIVSGSVDKSLKIWDAASGRCMRSFEGHTGSVRSVSWSADGTLIVSGSDDKTVKIWDASNGKRLQTLAGHSGYVWSVAWSADGKQIVSGSDDKTVKIWDASNGKCMQTLADHTGSVRCVAWSADGTRIVSGGDDKTVKIWDASNGKCMQSLAGHSGSVRSVSWSADGTWIVSGSADQTLKVWDAESGKCMQSLAGHSGSVRSVSWSADGTWIVSGSDDSTMREWDANTGQLLRTWVMNGDEVALVDFPNNKILHATPEAWRMLGWQVWDEKKNSYRLYPAEAKGPLPPW
ncbi:MAG: TIR domain-containing protein [Zavarzinella sp.]